MRPKIVFSNVSKSFNLYKTQSEKLLELISFRKAKGNFFALKNVSFTINEGEAVGIVGLNGSGKSTLSNLLAQIIPPTSGTIEINGETSLIAISVGLNNQLSGLENIELKCLMHGLKKEEIEKLKPEIIQFADIGQFINQPVKNYSSGMKSRLGFAISIHTNPDILIVDEALSVGDQTFYEKCLNKMNEFKSQGKTIIFISHSISQIRSFCDRVMWVHFGRVEKFDEADEVVGEYKEFIKWYNSLTETEKQDYKRKMLEGQYKEEWMESTNPYNIQKTRMTVKKENTPKKSILFPVQLVLLFLAVLFSASLLFGLQPVKTIGKYINTNTALTKNEITTKQSEKVSRAKTNQEKNAEENKITAINKSGLVVSGHADLYSDNTLKVSTGELSFLEDIDVLEQVGDTYKVRTNNNGTVGYTKSENIKLTIDDLPIVEREISDFLPLFPVRFSNANEYFLTFLDSKYDVVKSKLRGLSSEKTLENGKKLMTYSVYSAQFYVNEESMTDSILISNIDTNKEEWNQLKEDASIVSNDSLYYYFNTSKYKIVINLENKTATISLKSE